MSSAGFDLLSFSIALISIAAAVYWSFRRRKKGGKTGRLNIPPGSTGWPLVGETFQYAKQNRADVVESFMAERIRKYGKIFRTHLFGNNMIVSADPDLSRFMLLNDGRLFEPGAYAASVVKILGRTAMTGQTGERHRFLKGVSMSFMGIHRLSEHFLAVAKRCAVRVLGSWVENKTFPMVEEASRVTFDLIVKKVLGLESGDGDAERLREWSRSLMDGLISVPLNLPGFNYRKAIQARKGILKLVERLTEGRKARREAGNHEGGDDDFLGVALENPDLTQEEIGDLVITMLFGGHETSSVAIALAVYYLHGCPEALQQLREEHLEIDRKRKERANSELSWEDYRQMDFTQCVINEILRLGNIVRNITRLAKENVQFKGFDIPRGWSVMAGFTASHLDNAVYDNPQRFSPWRWQFSSASGVAKIENYMPFSLGAHRCAGMELAKMEIAVFLHYLVLKYGWQLVEPDHPTITVGFTKFLKGLPIKVHMLSH